MEEQNERTESVSDHNLDSIENSVPSESKVGAIKRRLREKRKRNNYNPMIEVIGLLALIVFYKLFSAGTSNLVCATVDAVVTSAGEASFIGTEEDYKELDEVVIGDVDKVEYYVTFSYEFGYQKYNTSVYFVENPNLSVGDTCQIRISRLHPEKVR